MSGEACDSIRTHLARGAPWEACDAFREAIANHPEDAELLYWGALAHARAGAGSRARAPEHPSAAIAAQRARDEYLAAYALAHDPFPGINAATLSMLLGDRDAAL